MPEGTECVSEEFVISKLYQTGSRGGISSSVATRIIKEFLESGVSLEEEPKEILAYSGPQPKENPEYNDIYYCLWNSEEWCDLI